MRTLSDVEELMMDIVHEPPPNAAEIEKVFPGVTQGFKPVYFCYGNTIYNPTKTVLTPSLIAHEAVHALQQKEYGVDEWWKVYLHNDHFRLEQETEAHRVEYEHYRANNNRLFSRQYLSHISERLSGSLYGNLITKSAAKKSITEDKHVNVRQPIRNRT